MRRLVYRPPAGIPTSLTMALSATVEPSRRDVNKKTVVSQSFFEPAHHRGPFADVVVGGIEIAREARGEGMLAVRLLGSNWDALGRRDALGSILTRPAGETDWSVEEFFETGRADVARLMRDIERLAPSAKKGLALDFGCGVGRLAQALTPHFQRVIGIDIAESMISRARAYNREPGRCHFEVNRRPHLQRFARDTFDLVWSHLVLQHIPPKLMQRYLQELLRVLAPAGLLVFQLPTEIDHKRVFYNAPVLGGPFKQKLPVFLRRTYRQVKYAIHRSVVPHMAMFGMPQRAIVEIVERQGGQILEIQPDAHGTLAPGFEYWVTKPSSQSVGHPD